VGFHVDQDYFVERAAIEGFTRLEARNMRFEREDHGWKKVGRWDWNANPFVGTRELDGLKTLMAGKLIGTRHGGNANDDD
jgi:hypothetical protein